MIMWGGPALIGALLASALLLRHWPLPALAVLLGVGQTEQLSVRQTDLARALDLHRIQGSEVVYPHGRYVLYGDGVSQPWQWVWLPAAPAAPPPPPQR